MFNFCNKVWEAVLYWEYCVLSHNWNLVLIYQHLGLSTINFLMYLVALCPPPISISCCGEVFLFHGNNEIPHVVMRLSFYSMLICCQIMIYEWKYPKERDRCDDIDIRVDVQWLGEGDNKSYSFMFLHINSFLSSFPSRTLWRKEVPDQTTNLIKKHRLR